MNFPQYRKYSNGKTFFCITSENEFEELIIIGNSYTVKHFKAAIFPDKLLINDMLNFTNNHWIPSDENEYLNKLEHCRLHFKKI